MKRKVLVVDDEADIVMVVRLILGRSGYDVVEARSVQEGKDALATGEPDAVLLDLRLPDGEGWEILDELVAAERHRSSPVIILSAHATDSTRERAMRKGATGYVSKPFTAEQLTSAVEGAMRAG